MTWANSRAWTPAEDQALEALWGQTQHQAIADALNRSVDSVVGRAARIGLKGAPARDSVGIDRMAEARTREAGRQFAAHFTKIARRHGWPVHSYRGTAA
jgi:hypothetical protein